MNFGYRHLGAFRSGSHPQPRTLKGRVAVARVLQIFLTLGVEQGDEPRLRDAEQRPHEPNLRQFANHRHPGEAIDKAAGTMADQIGFGLVVAMVRGQKMQAAMRRAPVGKKTIARRSRRFLDSGRRLFARPRQHCMRNLPRVQPASDRCRFGGAFRPQTVIDDQRPAFPAPRPGPAIDEDRQRQAVGTARHRNRDKRPTLKSADRG